MSTGCYVERESPYIPVQVVLESNIQLKCVGHIRVRVVLPNFPPSLFPHRWSPRRYIPFSSLPQSARRHLKCGLQSPHLPSDRLLVPAVYQPSIRALPAQTRSQRRRKPRTRSGPPKRQRKSFGRARKSSLVPSASALEACSDVCRPVSIYPLQTLMHTVCVQHTVNL
jgi:hypothetical protein